MGNCSDCLKKDIEEEDEIQEKNQNEEEK